MRYAAWYISGALPKFPQKDTQCTFNVTLRRVRVTIVVVENQ